MEDVLTQEQVNKYMSLLNQSQQKFIENNIKQKKKSKWLEVLAGSKGINIGENMSLEEIEEKIADWILVDILDGGYKQRPYKCDCGMALRYQYILKNSKTKEHCKLGVTCLEKHVSLPPEVLKDVKKGLYHIDLERDEILIRYQQNDFYHKELPRDLILPETLLQQLFLGLPLTGLQINQVKRLLVKYEDKKRFYQLLEKLSKEQRDLIFLLAEKEQLEVYHNLENETPLNYSEIDGLELSAEIKEFIELNLPLLERQHEFIEKQKKEKVFNSLSPEQHLFLERFSSGEKEELLYKIRNGYNTVNWDISDLNVDKDINEQIELKLPLLRRQRDILDIARNEIMKRKLNKKEELTFSLIMDWHLGTLQKVRIKEDKIPSGLKGDWEIIQQVVRELKKGEDFDYKTFKLLLSNLIIPLKIEKDNFL